MAPISIAIAPQLGDTDLLLFRSVGYVHLGRRQGRLSKRRRPHDLD
jgi:hypothetical protein